MEVLDSPFIQVSTDDFCFFVQTVVDGITSSVFAVSVKENGVTHLQPLASNAGIHFEDTCVRAGLLLITALFFSPAIFGTTGFTTLNCGFACP